MQVSDDDRKPGEVVRVGEDGVVLALLLVDAEHHRLRRRVARLDDVPAHRGDVVDGAGERVRGRDDDGQATRAQSALEGRRVEQHRGARTEAADDLDVAERTHHVTRGEADGILDRSRPAGADLEHDTPAPLDHGVTLFDRMFG